MLKNNKGAALLQVILVAAILVGMATLLLRASLSRVSSARLTRRAVSSQMLIETCQSQVNGWMSLKLADVFQEDLDDCIFDCNGVRNAENHCPDANMVRDYTCTLPGAIEGITYTVVAHMAREDENNSNSPCRVTYELHDNHQNNPLVSF